MLKKYKPLFISLFLSLSVGLMAALITMGDIKTQYALYRKPPFSPPGSIFGYVWTILYILMGISAYLIYQSSSKNKKQALTLYGIQLLFNFFWPILFFKLDFRLTAFFWLLALIFIILMMIKSFYKIRPLAAYLQIPYLLWCLFAAYLNFGIYLLNK